MVLISALLVSVATYAWITLSVAPELTGVATTIGANGNLEIALGKNIEETKIGEYEVTQANRTWGNLIDLSDYSYGLQTISLRPAILNSAGGAINMLHPLAYPTYRADGRVQSVYSNNMFAGTYDGVQFVTTPDDYGVHGIGTTQYHTSGVGGTFGPLSQRQEIFNDAKSNLWTAMTSGNYTSLCKSSKIALTAYCADGTGVSASVFDLNTFSNKVDTVVSAANENLKLIFTLLAASETTSAGNYFMAIELLKEEYPDYESVRSLVDSAIQAEDVGNVDTAIAELRAFQAASDQLQEVIASGAVDGSDGYSMEEIAQTVGLIFDLEKTAFTDTSEDYWSKVVPYLHYRRYISGKYWTSSFDGFVMSDISNDLAYSDGQDNAGRDPVANEIGPITKSLYRSLPLEKLDPAIAGLYSSHWIYWDNCAEEYQQLQEKIADLEAQVKALEDSGASEDELLIKTTELSDKKVRLQSLIDGEVYALDDERLSAIQSVMTDTVETLRQYTLWSIAYCACDGQVPDDAYRRVLEIVNSGEYIHPRTLYQTLCNYGVTPQDDLTNMVAAFEKLEHTLLFLQREEDDADAVTWNELSAELQRIFGTIEHRLYFEDNGYIHEVYANSILIEDTPFPTTVMAQIREEIEKCETAVGSTLTKKNLTHQITYKYQDEDNKQPWAQTLGILITFGCTDAYPFEYGTAEYTFEDRTFSTVHSMWYEQDFILGISIGVGSEDNFNESGLTTRQTRFKEAQENIAYCRNQIIASAVNPGKDMAALLMQIIAGESSVSLVTVSEYLSSLQQQVEYGEAMMYQATLAMAASSYAKDAVYEYAYSGSAPKNAADMIELLRSYSFDSTVLTALDQRLVLLNTQKDSLIRSLTLMKNYQDSETGTLNAEQISVDEAVALLDPVLDTDSLTLYGYVEKNNSGEDDPSEYVRTVLYNGYGSPSVQINGNQAIVTGRNPVTVFGNVYLSLGNGVSGAMLALVKSQTESYTPPTDNLGAEDIAIAENGENRYSYTIDANSSLYTLNIRTADTPYALTTNLWTYTGNTDYISADQTVVELYGYSIDMSFRTNVEGSDLLLQTDAVDRVYSDKEAETTDDYLYYPEEEIQTETSMGAGSYMEFEILDPSYSFKMAKEYMGCLRVVFTDTNTGYIYGYAALDTDFAKRTGVKGDKIKAPLRLYDKDTGLMIEGDTAQYLCHLEKNLEKNLTVYVYLDGGTVSQSLASATGEQSLAGVLNLQFCSSVDLKPAVLSGFQKD
ncbi:MAG: hypothetical protein IJC50_05645 [Clostridia bacterium]|nr:hypothetical protein [Clostridia bacterium]